MATKKKKYTSGAYRVPIKRIEPNDWNMNKVDPETFRKLKLNIEETMQNAGVIPPMVVRPHPDKINTLQIIDGEHRWKILKELGYEEADVFVVLCDTKTAMTMTNTLNYLRGEPDADKYAAYVGRIMREFDDVDVPYLAERFTESEDELLYLLDGVDIDIESIEIPDDPSELESPGTKDASTGEAWVELRFFVSSEQAEVIETEVRRISGTLDGKNVRGRAMEFMAVQSAQTPMESVIGDPATLDTKSKLKIKASKKKGKKAKKAKKAA